MLNKKYLNQSGQALLFVAFFVVMISLAAGLGATYFQSSAKNISSFVHQEETYYANAGLANAVQTSLQTYVNQNVSTLVQETQAQMYSDLLTQVQSAISTYLPTGFTVISDTTQTFVINSYPNPNGIVPRGPYKGLSAI